MRELLFDFTPTANNYVSLRLWNLTQDFFTRQGTTGS